MENPTPLETRAIVPKKMSRFLRSAGMFIVVLIVAAAGISAWYFWRHPCDIKAVEDAASFLVSQQRTYDGEYEFATTLLRSELTIPVNMLEDITTDTKMVAVPACMQTAKNELLAYMGSVTGAFRAYMTTEHDPAINRLLDQSNTHFNNFQKQLDRVKKCAPFCAPWE